MHEFFSYDYNWESIEFPAEIKHWKRFEKNKIQKLLLIFRFYHIIKKQ